MRVIMPNARRMFTLSGFLLVTVFGFSNAHAAVFVSGTGGCLEVRNASTLNGTPVQAFPCNLSFPEIWNFDGLQIFGIGTNGGGGKCLDVQGGGTAPGTPVQLFQCNGTRAQQWRYDRGALINPNINLCLDAGSGAPSTQATMQFCTNSPGQLWLIR